MSVCCTITVVFVRTAQLFLHKVQTLEQKQEEESERRGPDKGSQLHIVIVCFFALLYSR